MAERPDLLADVVVPIALAEGTEQLAHELRQYKDGVPAVRRAQQHRLTAVLAEFLRHHEKCLARAVKVTDFDLVTTVPSTTGRPQHPLSTMLGKSILQIKARFDQAMVAAPNVPADRRLRLGRFTVVTQVANRNVVLVDDTWTTGARMQSASAALKLAGAATVAGLVIGRWFDAGYEPSKAYLASAKAAPFSWERCCLGRSGLSDC